MNENYVTVIGGCNMDITGFPYNELIYDDSNPGIVKLSHGGVARNITENLAKLDVNIKFISIVGNDIYGSNILSNLEDNNIDISNILISESNITSTYLSVLDKNYDMKLAISSMGIIDEISIDYLNSKEDVIKNSKYVILDTNLSKDVIQYLVQNYNNKFIIDAVSTSKAMKIKEILKYFHTIKLNRIEAETISEIKIENEESLEKIGDFFMKSGTKNLFITLGAEGVFYINSSSKGIVKPPNIHVINANGAGDAFTAAITYCFINEKPILDSVKYGIASSILTLQHENTINPNLSIQNINKIKEELT